MFVPAPPDDEEPQDSSCFSKILTALGVLLSVFIVVVNICDVATDVAVAAQFYQDRHTVWFALVLTFLVVPHVIYMTLGAELLHTSPAWKAWFALPRPLRWLVMIPAAPLLPLLNFILVTWHRAHAPTEPFSRWAQPVDFPVSVQEASQAAQEEMAAARRSRILQRRVQMSMRAHVDKFGLFYVESAVEAAPQAIIQLLAITFLDEASPVQLVSLCLSLFSITSKFVMLARAYDARVMVFKFALAAHDVFSTFYLFSTIVAVETVKDTDFYGLRVSWLGYIWIWKVIATAAISFCLATGLVLRIWFYRHFDMLLVCAVYVAGILICIPLALLFEVVKLSYFTLGINQFEPMKHAWPSYVTLLSFLERDDSDSSRLRHTVATLIGNDSDVERHPTVTEAIDECKLNAADLTKPFTLWTVRDSSYRRRDEYVCENVFIAGCVVAAFIVQLFSVCYPFINAGLQNSHPNILQATCLYATAVALLVSLVAAPSAYRYARLNICLGWLSYCTAWTFPRIAKIIADYFAPPVAAALQAAIRRGTLPLQPTHVVAQYLTPYDLGLGALTMAECNALKRLVKPDDRIEIRAVPSPKPNEPFQ